MDILEPSDLKPLFELNFELGDDQKNLPSATASHDVQKYFKKINHGAEFGIMSYNFPLTEWGNKKWIEWLTNVHQNYNIKIKLVGGPKVQSSNVIKELLKKEIIELRLLNVSETFHILYIDNPRQLWVEEYHSYGTARKIHYTDKPYNTVWDMLIKLFNKVCDRGKHVEEFDDETDDETIEDINVTHLIVEYLYRHKTVNTLTFFEDLKRIIDGFHSQELAKKINFVPDRFSKYWSRAVSESLSDLLAFEFVKACREEKTLSCELTDKGRELPNYYKEMPAWETLQKYSYLFDKSYC